MQYAPAVGQFKSAPTTIGIIYLMLGFIPDYFELFSAIDQTSPNIERWFNKATLGFSSSTNLSTGVDRTILDTGSTGVLTVDTTPVISAYAGGDVITATEVATAATAAHVDRQGNLVTVPSGGQIITQPGLTIAADAKVQVAAKYNLWIAWRSDK